jgi:hypothetical protein
MSTEPHGNEDIVPDFLHEPITVPETPSSEEETDAVLQDDGVDVVSQATPAASQGEGATERNSYTTHDGLMEGRPVGTWDDPDIHFVTSAKKLSGMAGTGRGSDRLSLRGVTQRCYTRIFRAAGRLVISDT